MTRSIKSTGSTSHCSVDINSRRGKMSHSSSRAVEFVLSVKDKEDIQSASDLWVWFVFRLIESIEHIKEVFNISKVFLWLIVASSNTMSVGIGCEGWDITEQSVNLLVSDFLVIINFLSSESRVCLGMQSRYSAKGTNKHTHRMSIISE